MDIILDLLKYFLFPLFIGGGLWKGLDSVANALSKRSEAKTAAGRLDFDQMQSNYRNAMDLIDKQSKRIDTLTAKVERYEQRIEELNDKIDAKESEQEKSELAYAEKIKELEIQIEQLHQENKKLKAELEVTKCNYEAALKRIKKLEEGDTGPLAEH